MSGVHSIFGPGGLLDRVSQEEEQQGEPVSGRNKRLVKYPSHSLRDIIKKENDNPNGSMDKLTIYFTKSAESSKDTLRKDESLAEIRPSIQDILRHKNCSSPNEDEMSLEEKLFANDFLLRNIFKHLSLAPLKSCRLVNRLWFIEATKAIRKTITMEPLQITNETVEFWSCKNYKQRPPFPLEDFQELIENSVIFPCTSFLLAGPLDITNESTIYNFFKENGHIVKSLHLWYNTVTPKNNEMIGDVLTKLLPNLEILSFQNDSELLFTTTTTTTTTPPKTNLIENQNEMKKLNTINYYTDTLSKENLLQILKMARNLKNIFWNNILVILVHSKSLQVLLELEAIPLLRNINLLFLKDAVKIYEKIVEQGMSLGFVEISSIYCSEELPLESLPRVGIIISKLLQNCSGKLRRILRMHPIGHIPHVEIPTLPNVTTLDCEYCQSKWFAPESSFVPMFPLGLNLSHKFPNLRTFHIVFMDGIAENLRPQDVFPQASNTPLETVENVEIAEYNCRHIPTPWIKYFCDLFPNVKNARFDTIADFESAAGYIWNLGRVESLRIGIAISVGRKTYLRVDSAFTGFSEESVRKLYGRLGEELSGEEVEDFREKSSIVDLKQLKHLQINFVDHRTARGDVGVHGAREEVEVIISDSPLSQYMLKVEDKDILSHVTREYGFNFCPLLAQSDIRIAFVDKHGDIHN